MDWGQFDPEGALRQRYIDIAYRTEDAREEIRRSNCTWQTFENMYDITWIYHENGLEGVVLTYPEIRSAVDNKIVSDVSLLPTYREITSQKKCVDLVREKALNKRSVITIDFLKELHGLLINNPEMTGVYRKDIPIHRTYFHEITHPGIIEDKLKEVLTYLKAKREKDVHPIEFAANVHHRFMRCFPFSKFSGMIGRLLLNFVLVREEYIPVVIHATDRQRYYEALRGSEKDFRRFLCEVLENSLDNTIKFFHSQQHVSDLRRA